jgi:hypothetical protein
MADEHQHGSADHQHTHRVTHEPATPDRAAEEAPQAEALPLAADPRGVLGDPHLEGRGNNPVRQAAMIQMQRTYGNRAVQRFLQVQRAPAAGTLGKIVDNEEELQKAGADGTEELTKIVGDEEELQKAAVMEPVQRAASVSVSQDNTTSTATQALDPARAGLLAKVNSTVASGAAASHALGAGVYGLTFPEKVEATITAQKTGANWNPKVTDLKGLYSLQTRLLPGMEEVTGPAGNTDKTNYNAQIRDLKALGNNRGAHWYMISAVAAHENHHATHFQPSLVAAEPTITTALEAVSIPDAADMTADKAVKALQASAAFQSALTAAQATWLAEILKAVRADNDHGAGGPCEQAEHTIVDPMITSICTHVKDQKWPASPDCP